jgi:hypothetical protein
MDIGGWKMRGLFDHYIIIDSKAMRRAMKVVAALI